MAGRPSMPNRSPNKVIRDKDFARRLLEACERNPHCPTESPRGKQKWLYEHLNSRFGLRVSAEATRKWFSGEARPRPLTMKKIAAVLDEDEGWLSLGIKAESTPAEKRVRNALANGAVNLTAGLIQLQGGNVAFPEDDDETGTDVYAILKGRQYRIMVRLGFDMGRDLVKFYIGKEFPKHHVIGVISNGDATDVTLIDIPHSLITAKGEFRAESYELTVRRHGDQYRVGRTGLNAIKSFRALPTLDG